MVLSSSPRIPPTEYNPIQSFSPLFIREPSIPMLLSLQRIKPGIKSWQSCIPPPDWNVTVIANLYSTTVFQVQAIRKGQQHNRSKTMSMLSMLNFSTHALICVLWEKVIHKYLYRMQYLLG